MNPLAIEKMIRLLADRVDALSFAAPVSHVYNPLGYARKAHLAYWLRYGRIPKEVILLGMNPGPWGMVQTGIPFGDVGMVTQWLNIVPEIDMPNRVHPKRPIWGVACPRREVSGRRLWGWAQTRFEIPDRFFERFWVANYCPLTFMESSGRNRTPNQLPKSEKIALLSVCDHALRQMVDGLKPEIVVGVGQFASQQAQRALAPLGTRVGQITHPSPANPRANQGWAALIENELTALGITLT